MEKVLKATGTYQCAAVVVSHYHAIPGGLPPARERATGQVSTVLWNESRARHALTSYHSRRPLRPVQRRYASELWWQRGVGVVGAVVSCC